MGNWEVDTDDQKNRLYLTLEGRLSTEEIEDAADAVIEASSTLDLGFDQVNDMSAFEPADPEALDHVKRGKRGIVENGIAATCRVVSESATGQMQFDRAGEDEEEYAVAKAESFEQAEKLLDKRREQMG